MTREEMEQLVGHTGNKSEKIRLLFGAGVERADIARFLEISYQHVQNVLKRSGLLGKGTQPAARQLLPGEVHVLTVGKDGAVTLPAAFVEAQGISAGDSLICRVTGADLVIMSREAAAGALLEAARRCMPGEAALLGALLDPPRSG